MAHHQLKHVLSTKQFLNKRLLANLFRTADELARKDKTGRLHKILTGKILASVFYEPSTRTRFSFEAAMLKLGGTVITTESASHFSSVIKGESLPDTIKIISGYVDVIVLRHHEEGSAQIAAEASSVPIINAGDGSGEHPTQALLDLYTLKKELGRTDKLKIALIGDLLYGRTIHSLLNLLMLYKNTKIYLVSPPQLRLPAKYKSQLKQNGIYFEETSDLYKNLDEMDVLYVTRIQKERFGNLRQYEKLKGSYVINKVALKRLKRHAIIMHPLPRVKEVAAEVDDDPRAAYFRQARNGLYIRMALLDLIIKK
ncbi:MAG: aspartate carbamoyltransferase [Candidatus Sungiibacteriota bacterium]|uniref:Aspartate carbamoyltransferase n=1 Tax=Candidatus Sungiibacteriota bacterium TaxID=2750080 RepID=A0A7T5UQG7_9BACT|nr:MAG: aspartate carbamoyltransferase [Candidatus Sungbacteria bacterium]